MFDLSNKIAVVTGGGSGIGLAITQLFAKQGAIVHILELNETAALEAAKGIMASGGKAVAHACNVALQSEVDAVFESIGLLDILVNNAGIAHIGNVENTSEADFDRLFSVNVKGVYHCMRAAIPRMKEQGGGVILNMASVAALVGLSDRFAYSMTKGAVLAMSIAAAKDYVKENIRVNTISPARVHTPFVDGFLAKNYPGKEAEMFEKLSQTQPVGRMASPNEIGSLALYLCSDEASFITGTDYPIDGGFVKLNT
jgi:NAD(P)-dependent dehydrogenase (short-subunit alcohol dehydrogenase family)